MWHTCYSQTEGLVHLSSRRSEWECACLCVCQGVSVYFVAYMCKTYATVWEEEVKPSHRHWRNAAGVEWREGWRRCWVFVPLYPLTADDVIEKGGRFVALITALHQDSAALTSQRTVLRLGKPWGQDQTNKPSLSNPPSYPCSITYGPPPHPHNTQPLIPIIPWLSKYRHVESISIWERGGESPLTDQEGVKKVFTAIVFFLSDQTEYSRNSSIGCF